MLIPSLVALTAPALSLRGMQDSLPRPGAHDLADSTVDVQLLGDKVTPVIQWFFQKEPWVMWSGAVLAIVIAFVAIRWAWPRRHAFFTWIVTRNRTAKIAMVGGAVAALLVAAGLGFTGYHFMETDKRFCNGCHIFVSSGQAWVKPDTGWYTLVPRLEGKHDTINCHTCHPLKPIKEGVKLVFWMSGVRDEEIPEHARVPRTKCEECHVKGAAKETWEAVAATAGHRTHLESDSSAMADKKECLTCHARTAHRFQPADTTCVQDGCHLTDETNIVLGAMTSQTDLHCTVCHEFTKPVAALATRDSAEGALRPNFRQCFSCHQMERLLPGFATEKDPHGGTCGMCHNPHTQQDRTGAITSCTDAQCHSDWRQQPFHVGLKHKKAADDCTLCHDPHAARVDASDCTGCHETVRANPKVRVPPPLPFDTTKALNQSSLPGDADPAPLSPGPAHERPSKVKGDAPPWDDDWGRPVNTLTPAPDDTFSHPTHKKLACLTCHQTSDGHGRLTFEPPRGCQICHHEAPARSDCAACHSSDELLPALARQVAVRVPEHAARTRPVDFLHQAHDEKGCVDCHTTRVTLEAADSAASCAGCHSEHHEAGRDCAACHRTEAIREAHQRPAAGHVACDACHTASRIATLMPARSFCLACHDPEQDHYKEKECSECHFLASPGDLKRRLVSAQRGAR